MRGASDPGQFSTIRMMRDPRGFWPVEVLELSHVTLGQGRNRVKVVSDPAIVRAILADRAGTFEEAPVQARILGASNPKELLEDQVEQRRAALSFAGKSSGTTSLANIASVCRQVASEWFAASKDANEIDVVLDARRLTLGCLCRAFLLMEHGDAPIAPLVEQAAMQIDALPAEAAMARRFDALHDLAIKYLSTTERGLDRAAPDYRRRLHLTLTILDAGHDNSAATLAWTMWLLAHRPDLQDAIRHESKSDHAGAGGMVRTVIWEVLRLYPPLLMLARKAKDNFRESDFSVEQGETVFTALYAMHRHRDQWDDADKFDPTRFLDTAGRFVRPQTVLPFGTGPRGCVGLGFAQVVLETAIPALLSKIELVPDSRGSLECAVHFALRPKGRNAVLARPLGDS